MTHRFSAAVAPALALALAACGSERPTAPEAAAAPATALAVQGEALAAIRGTVDDANARLLPGLGAGAQSRLGAPLAAVQTALDANDADALATSLAAAHRVLAAERRAQGPDSPAAADLDALELTLGGLGDALPARMRSAAGKQ